MCKMITDLDECYIMQTFTAVIEVAACPVYGEKTKAIPRWQTQHVVCQHALFLYCYAHRSILFKRSNENTTQNT